MERRKLVQGGAGCRVCSSSIKLSTGLLQCQIKLSFFEMESLRSRECRHIVLKAFSENKINAIFVRSIKRCY